MSARWSQRHPGAANPGAGVKRSMDIIAGVHRFGAGFPHLPRAEHSALGQCGDSHAWRQRLGRSLCPFPTPLPGATWGASPHFLNLCSLNYVLVFWKGQGQDSSRPVILCSTRSWELTHSSGTLATCSARFHLDRDPLEGRLGHTLKKNPRTSWEVFTVPPVLPSHQ